MNRFVRRELRKEKSFDELGDEDQSRAIERDMKRLAVVALGMYNRRQLHTLSTELNADLSFFGLERKKAVESGRALSQADMLLGSFFFVHKSKAVQKGETPATEEGFAFEFLHNTFGEFLTADFIVRQALAETQSLADLERSESLRADLQSKLERPDGFSKEWFACLIYTPLFSRPAVLEMLREWAVHCLKRHDRKTSDFLDRLAEITLNQIRRILCRQEMPAIMQGVVKTPRGTETTPFAKHPLLGHMSIYSMNLITLRTILSPDGYRFIEDGIDTHEDGSRPWDKLTHIWRSWFSLDNLSGLTAILSATRSGNEVTISPRTAFSMPTSSSRLEMVFNVSATLADDITTGLSGLADYNSNRPDPERLEVIQKSLDTEGIDLKLQLAVKRLVSRYDGPMSSPSGIDERHERHFNNANEVFLRAIDSGRAEELRTLLGIFWAPKGGIAPYFVPDHLPPDLFFRLMDRSPRLCICFLRLFSEHSGGSGLGPRHIRDFNHLTLEVLRPRFVLNVANRWPDVGLELIDLLQEMGVDRHSRHWEENWGEQLIEASNMRSLGAVWLVLMLGVPVPGSPADGKVAELVDRLDPRELTRLFHDYPAVGTRFIGLLSKIKPRRLAAREAVTAMFHAQRVEELIIRRPGVAVELIRLFIKTNPKAETSRVLTSLLAGLDPRSLRDGLFREPADCTAVVMLLWSLTPERIPSDEWLDRFIESRSMSVLVTRRHGEAGELLRLIVKFLPSRWSTICLERVTELQQSRNLQNLLRRLSLGSALQLRSLAREKGSLQLLSDLEAILSGSD